MDELRSRSTDIRFSALSAERTIMKCLQCKDCLKEKCDIYRSEQLSKAWNELLNNIGKGLGLYKLLDWLTKKSEK